MNIKIENNKIQIADISAFTNRTIYSISESKDSVTFMFSDKMRQTVIVRETTVNGTQMTPDNIDELLSSLFMATTADTGSNAQSEAYSKAEYTDPLVFPQPTRSGHIVEFYNQSVLYRSYQWNGWDWIIVGAQPNFIFTQGDTMASVLGRNVLYTSNVGNVYKLSLNSDSDYTDMQIYSSDIKLSSLDYTLGSVFVVQNPNSIVELSDINANSLRTENKNGYDDAIVESFSLENCIVSSASINSLAKKALVNNLKYQDKEIGQTMISIRSLDITITNNMTDNISTYCIQPDKTKPSDSNINISNNATMSDSMGISLYGNSDGATITNCDITIKNNTGLTELQIHSFSDESKIKSFDGQFDKSLRNVSVYFSNFTQSAFDNFVNALSNISKEESIDRNIQFLETTPLLSDTQKSALVGAGWAVN